jgi:hypothetical protein
MERKLYYFLAPIIYCLLTNIHQHERMAAESRKQWSDLQV